MRAKKTKNSACRFYVFIPLPLAAAIGLEAGEEFQWSLADKNSLSVHRISQTQTSALDAKGSKGVKRSRK